MAKLQPISQLFIAADYQLDFTIYNAAETAIVDVAGMALSWMLKKALTQPDTAKLLEKTVGSGIVVSGTYDPNPSINTQKVSVRLNASDTLTFKPRVIAHELKRMDAGFETPFTYGPATLVRGVHRT